MDVTGTDPRARTGLFLWPWATTGYSNMNSSNTGGTNIQATPPLGLSSPSTGSFEQGIQMQHQQQNQSQQQDSSLESFYSRLPYSAGGAVPSLQQMQQHQRQQREAAVAAAQAISEMQGQQQGLQQSSRMGPISSQASQSHSQIPTQPPPPPPQFDQRSGQLMNGRQAQATINSASSSPLNNSAYHNPSLSPNSQNQHQPHQQSQQQQQQFQRHYSSAGSLQNVTGASPLDGRISSSASPSGSSVAPSYSLKRSSNDFNSATAMALALQAVAKGDRQMPPPPPSLSMHNSSTSNQPVDHLQGGDMFSSMNSTNYLFQPPNMSKGSGGNSGGGIHSRSSSEAAAQMAAAMVANEMGMDPRSTGSAHPLSGLHAAGGFLPDFLSSSSTAMGDTKMDPSGGVGLRGPFDGPPTMSGGLGMMEGLPGIYGHAAKGYKCKICQHVSQYSLYSFIYLII